jgi:hypothetical protein
MLGAKDFGSDRAAALAYQAEQNRLWAEYDWE